MPTPDPQLQALAGRLVGRTDLEDDDMIALLSRLHRPDLDALVIELVSRVRRAQLARRLTA